MSLIIKATLRMPDYSLADYHYGIPDPDLVRKLAITPCRSNTIMAISPVEGKLVGGFLGGRLEMIQIQFFNAPGPQCWAARDGVLMPYSRAKL